MLLKDIIKNLDIVDIKGNLDIQIDNVQYDSRKVGPNGLFVCVRGFNVDGHDFIQSALDKGAIAYIVEEDIYVEGYTFIKVDDSRRAMASVADNFYNNPTKELNVIGVTGTNGKTSITNYLKDILNLNGEKIGLIGTIKIAIGEKEIESSSTTPESIDLQGYFKEMLNSGCRYCAMEVSSHSLELNRVDDSEFKLGIFTNLTPDHLDFHKNLDEYRKAKEKLFYKTTLANIINIDDEGGKKIYENVKSLKTPVYTYGIDNEADFYAKDIHIDYKGVKYTLVTPTYETTMYVPVPGKFTVYNSLAVVASAYLLGISKEIIVQGFQSTKGVAGRFESVPNDKEISVIVDYAHTPDALENILKTAQGFAKGDIITVFGCGGDRDKTKRPVMGSIAQNYSNYCMVTSDNPRTEDPKAIIEDILTGLDKEKENFEVVIDRKEAIERAIKKAKKGDVVIIAGKGHENYQIIGKTKYHFDDKEIATNCLKEV